jgi:ribonuclease P protein component
VGGEAVKALLASASISKTPHFSLHALPSAALVQKLPTAAAPVRPQSVDNLMGPMLVVPKRHAKRAVTRNLIKRQMRHAARRRQTELPPATALLIRLRGAFDVRQFPSAASAALRAAVRSELDALFDRAGAAR